MQLINHGMNNHEMEQFLSAGISKDGKIRGVLHAAYRHGIVSVFLYVEMERCSDIKTLTIKNFAIQHNIRIFALEIEMKW